MEYLKREDPLYSVANEFCETIFEDGQDNLISEDVAFDYIDSAVSFPLKYRCLLCKEIYLAEDELESHNITVHFYTGSLSNEPSAIDSLEWPTIEPEREEIKTEEFGEAPTQSNAFQCNSKQVLVNSLIPEKHQIICDTFETSLPESKASKKSNVICLICDGSFPSRYKLKRHEIEVHGGAIKKVHSNNDSKKYRCQNCTKGFDSQKELELHKENPKFVCQHCGTRKCSLLRLIQHEKTHTNVSKHPGPHICGFCSKEFTSHGNLKAHAMEHAGIRKLICELCGKAFPSKRRLESHKLSIHSNEKPYKCDTCDSSFKFQRNLIEHVRIHTKERPFSCKICGKSFRHSSSLWEHKATHDASKCPICNRRFESESEFIDHILTHGSING